MSKVNLDSQNLNSRCLINLCDSINTIDRALDIFNGFDIPSDFSKRNELLNVRNKLRDINTSLSDVKSWLENSCNDYDKLISNLKNQARQLPIEQIKQRTNII